MKKLFASAATLMAGCLLSFPAGAATGERVDFNGTVRAIHGDELVVQQAETGKMWTIHDRARRWTDRQGYSHTGYTNLSLGQPVHILGTEVAFDRIQADQIDGMAYLNAPQTYTYNDTYYTNGYSRRGYYSNPGLSIQSPVQNANVPGDFSVQGQAAPYSSVQITVRSQRELVPGLINLTTGRQRYSFTTQADSDGYFNVPVHATYGGDVYVDVKATSPNGTQTETQTLRLYR